MFLDNFFLLSPESLSMFWYLVIVPSAFSVQDSYDMIYMQKMNHY